MTNRSFLNVPGEVVEIGALAALAAVSTAIVVVSVAARVYGTIALTVANVVDALNPSTRRA